MSSNDNIVFYFAKKFFPLLVFSGMVGGAIGYCMRHSPSGLFVISLIFGIIFLLGAVFYISCSFQKQRAFLENAGSFITGIGCSVISLKLLFREHLTGDFRYYIGAWIILACIVGPLLVHFGYDPDNYKQNSKVKRHLP